MGLIDDDASAQQEFDFSTITEVKEVGKRDVNKLLKEDWKILAVATTRDGSFNYSMGRAS